MNAASPEALAQVSSTCRLCSGRIQCGTDYIAKVPPIGWVHASCARGYLRAMAENREAS